MASLRLCAHESPFYGKTCCVRRCILERIALQYYYRVPLATQLTRLKIHWCFPSAGNAGLCQSANPMPLDPAKLMHSLHSVNWTLIFYSFCSDAQSVGQLQVSWGVRGAKPTAEKNRPRTSALGEPSGFFQGFWFRTDSISGGCHVLFVFIKYLEPR